MSVQFEHRPYTDARPDTAPPTAAPRPTAARTETRAPAATPAPVRSQRDKGHNGLIALGIFVAVVVVFAAMVLLTMLAGGDGYVR